MLPQGAGDTEIIDGGEDTWSRSDFAECIVVADSRFARDGRCIEEIGTYDPLSADKKIVVDAERANYWLANGAQPTDTVRVLLKKALAAE